MVVDRPFHSIVEYGFKGLNPVVVIAFVNDYPFITVILVLASSLK
jgi:hypothetical protein